MKLLKEIIYSVRIEDVIGSTNIAVEHLAFDSREVTQYSVFIAMRGTQVDGHLYIEKAIDKGAVAIICEELPEYLKEGITYIKVLDSADALGTVAANFYDSPSEKLKLIGVTGTNGKTTSVSLMYELFQLFGAKVGLISTVENKIHNEVYVATHTTPNAIELNKLLAKMVEKGCQFCFMEVSSHAIAQKRIAGVHFSGAVFTNITRDHLDYHKTFDNYIAAKKAFFDALPAEAFALTNIDQEHGETMVQDTKAKIYHYGLNSFADFKAKILENRFDGSLLSIDNREIHTKLIGEFNAYNSLVAYAVGVLLGKEELEVLTMLSNLSAPEGRFQHFVSKTGVIAIVDYAHTSDALENVLKTINNIRTGNELVITVVGCGGDRDKGKRPLMAEVASRLSDQVIFTSDNPRTENPESIITEMEAGVAADNYKKTLSITQRKEAIKTACNLARKDDIILIAGKGHEKYQLVNGEVLQFDDKETVIEILKKLNK
jgi:UDP-N-acetylmuramoyl-L-alanyl-D-glutamate--2,6-diaminopimelate ligase